MDETANHDVVPPAQGTTGVPPVETHDRDGRATGVPPVEPSGMRVWSAAHPTLSPVGRGQGEGARKRCSFWTFAGCLALGSVVIACYFWFFRTRLTVRTSPPGCSVFVNGRVAGGTPVSLSGMGIGKYCVRLEKEGYDSVVRVVSVPRKGLVLEEKLAPCGTGTLIVQLKPRGAEVLLDGELLGHTPLEKTGVPAGLHELVVRKTNHKAYIQQIEIQAGKPLVYKDFGLEDIILTMLRANVAREKQSVRQYMDLGHYLFVNDELDEAAEVYVQAQQVAASPLEFGAEISEAEKSLEYRLRAEDANRLVEEIKRKRVWPNKDLAKFRRIVDQGQEQATEKYVTEWVAVRELVMSLIQDQKYPRAEALLLRHIAAVSKLPKLPQVNLPQAYIELLLVRLRMHNLQGARETKPRFLELYGTDTACLRQAANGIYNTASRGYEGQERTEVLGMAEQMLTQAVLFSRPGHGEPEMHALCKFELANVLCLQGRAEKAAPLYREAIAGTKDESTKELRTQNLVACLKTLDPKSLGEVRALLAYLSKSPRADVAKKAQEELSLLMTAQDNK